MKDNRFNWQVEVLDDVDINQLVSETKLSATMVKIMVARGFKTSEAIQNFIRDDMAAVHDPMLLHDMQKALDRIFVAIEAILIMSAAFPTWSTINGNIKRVNLIIPVKSVAKVRSICSKL